MIGTHWLFIVDLFLNRDYWHFPGTRFASLMTYVTVAATTFLCWRNNWEFAGALEEIGFIKPDVIDSYYERAIRETLQKYNIPRADY